MKELIEENWRAIVAAFVFTVFMLFGINYFMNVGNDVMPNMNAKNTSAHVAALDGERPVITAKDGSELTSMKFQVTINEGGTIEPDHFEPMDYVKAMDAVDGDITDSIKVYGSVDILKEGPQELKYVVTNSKGLKTTQKMTVIVDMIDASNYGAIYAIKYNLNGGTLLNKKLTYTSDTEGFTLGIPTKAGYTFKGWIDDDLPNKTPVLNVTIRQGSKGDRSFTAAWDLSGYNVIFDTNYVNRDTGNTDQYAKKLNYNEKYGELPEPSRKGYTFDGWYTAKTDGTKITADTKMGNRSVTVYAHWTIVDYKINYDLKGGKLSSPVYSYTYETPTFTIGIPTKDNYDFIGWTSSTATEPDRNYKVERYTYGDIDLTANYTPVKFSIEYELNGGTLNQNYTYSYDVETRVELYAPTRTGYTFNGWYETSDFSGSAVTAISEGTSGNKKFYASWTMDTYTITYDLDGGTVDGLVNNYTVNDNITLPTPTKEGHNFIGWSENGSEPSYTVTIAAGSTGNKSFKAIWEVIPEIEPTPSSSPSPTPIPSDSPSPEPSADTGEDVGGVPPYNPDVAD